MLKKIQTILRQEGFFAVAQRISDKLLRELRAYFEEAGARLSGSYSLAHDVEIISLTGSITTDALDDLYVEDCIPIFVAQHYINHRFDLLGSGWVQVGYGMYCRGMAGYQYDMADSIAPDTDANWLVRRLNKSNLNIAREIWKRVDAVYAPIDWQLDFKSGYRWSEKTWASRLVYGHQFGVDVKLPWELSRMQHLPQMAMRAARLGEENEESQLLVRNIRNQWLDFIATNPPGFGVNWMCPMDIAIRGANWCLAWDVLKAGGFALEADEENILAHSLLDHGRYITQHLEWSQDRGNHYLTDICGLVFIAAYLPETIETDNWLAFAISQLQAEILFQFLPDGGHFEGSTAYHRLSLEMVLYATAVILRLSQIRLRRLMGADPKGYYYLPTDLVAQEKLKLYRTGISSNGDACFTPFASEVIERLEYAVIFFSTIVKPSGRFPQIGDNDSGRFFKLHPVYEVITVREAKQKYLNLDNYTELDDDELYHFEDGLQGFDLLQVAATLGFYMCEDVMHSNATCLCKNSTKNITSALARGNRLLASDHAVNEELLSGNIKKADDFDRLWTELACDNKAKILDYDIPERLNKLSEINLKKFEYFGLYVFRHSQFYMTIRCMTQSNQQSSSHCHNDQLSITLDINNESILLDPGTYVYTPLPRERLRYRSVEVHSPASNIVNKSNNARKIFDHLMIQCAGVDYVTNTRFMAHVLDGEDQIDLLVYIEKEKISIIHFDYNYGHIVDSRCDTLPPISYSPGYGVQENVVGW